MHSILPIKCIIVAFTTMYYGVSGCTYQFINCTYEIVCESASLDVSFDQIYYHGNHEDKCDNIIHYYNDGYNLVPVRLVLEGPTDTRNIIPEYTLDTTLLRFIVYLDITNEQLKNTPSFYEMEKLKIMNLSNNDLRFANLFNSNELVSLENLDLSYNLIDSIEVNDNYYVYKNLRSLNMSHNYLTYIPDGTFEIFKELNILDISYNNLITINHYTFDGLKSLKFLYLSSNNISNINLSPFRFSHLEELHLDNNNIEKLTKQDFDKLNSLRILNLDFNKIDRINEETFNSLHSLSTIRMHHNLLSYVHKDAFSLNNNLKNVDFSSNLLSNLPKNLFKYKNITFFSISENVLKGALSRGMFEGLQLITNLDIKFQGITAIEEYAFFGLEKLATLLLSNNVIRTVSKLSFKSLKNLNVLDLSNNFIISLDFDKADLISLESLSLRKNFITQIRQEDFINLSTLRVLDISSNNISNFEPDSFKSLETVESFEIYDNPLNGSLVSNSFQGLFFPPVLDLSCTLLRSVENGSFNGMVQLQYLNLSHSYIENLEFNAFINTGSLKLIDLSYNKLHYFYVNCSDVKNLTTLFLNNNDLVHISNNVFKGMLVLNKLILSHNRIESIDNAAFENQINLHCLDLSFNNNLTFHISMIDKAGNLEKLFLSGLKNKIDFKNINITSLSELEISHSKNIFNVSELHLDSIRSLENLVLKNNSVTKLEITDFNNINAIKLLDLSLNRISYIQPGTFKENIFLYKLNLSHNLLTSLSYGIFQGLNSLEVLDVSFNSIHDLHRARFYDTGNLKILIADNNKITEISEDFDSIRLNLLSIGDNLLSCEKVSYMKYRQRIPVSAIHKDETNKHNIDGITCENNNKPVSAVDLAIHKDMNNIPVLVSIKDLLLNISKTNSEFKIPNVNNSNDILKNISDTIHNLRTDQVKEQIQLKNITYHVADEVDITNSILERILKVIIGLGTVKGNTVNIEKHIDTDNIRNGRSLENISKINDLVTDISEMKQELLYLENIISEIDKKLTKSRTLNNPSKSENANKTENDILVDRSSDRSFIFLEVCVSLILIIMVCFFLYIFYQSKILISGPWSINTQHITESMDNTNL